MAKSYRTELFRGPLMRISYAFGLFTLREKQSDSDKARKTYESTLIMPISGDWSEIHKRIQECVVGQWGEKGAERFKNGLVRNPILNGDGKEARNKETGELHPGMGPDVKFIRVQANEAFPPAVYTPSLMRIHEAGGLPSGSWGYPVLNVFAWNNASNGDGVSFGIDSFQLMKKAEGDEVLGGGGGRADPSKFFEAVKDDGTTAPKGADASSMFG